MSVKGSVDDPMRSVYFNGSPSISVAKGWKAYTEVRDLHSTKEALETKWTEGRLLLRLSVIVDTVVKI